MWQLSTGVAFVYYLLAQVGEGGVRKRAVRLPECIVCIRVSRNVELIMEFRASECFMYFYDQVSTRF